MQGGPKSDTPFQLLQYNVKYTAKNTTNLPNLTNLTNTLLIIQTVCSICSPCCFFWHPRVSPHASCKSNSVHCEL